MKIKAKLLSYLILLLIIGFARCATQVSLSPTKTQQQFFRSRDMDYPVRIGLDNDAVIVHFSATSDFKIFDALNDSLLKMGKANEKWLCIFPKSEDGAGETEVWRLQIGAFRTEKASDNFCQTIKLEGQDKAYILFENGWFKVRVGNFASRDDALKFKQSIAPKFDDSFPVKISLIPERIGDIEIVSPDKNYVNTSHHPIGIVPVSSEGFVEFEDDLYRGRLEFGISKYGKNYVANVLPLEDYLKGVLPSEMNPNWGMEALKAQAIAARTQTLNRLGKHKEDGYDLCSGEHCQVYKGVGVEKEKSNKAVDETAGQIIVYDGNIIEAVYSANCGGHTENASEIWGNRKFDYLVGIRDFVSHKEKMPNCEKEWEHWIKYPQKAFCQNHDSEKRGTFRWRSVISRKQIEQNISEVYDIGRVMRIIPLHRGVSGRLNKVKIVGTRQTIELNKELTIRRIFGGLKSSCFIVENKFDTMGSLPDSFVFFGAGYGHGVGMCQTGAAGMADLGYNYKEILRNYYRGTKIINFEKIKAK